MHTIRITTLFLALAVIIGCSEQTPKIDISQKTIPPIPLLQCTAAERLLPKFDSSGAVRISDVKNIAADSLASYMGKAANRYRYYHALGLAGAKYTLGKDTVEVELAQFEKVVDAFGFAFSQRPIGKASLKTGAETFVVGRSLYFVSAEFVGIISLLSDGDSPEIAAPLVRDILPLIEAKRPPDMFLLFPSRDQVVASARYYTYDYLGVYGLNDVYTVDYISKGDTVTLFMIPDTSGAKLERIRALAESTGRVVNSPKRLNFDAGEGLAFDDPDRGIVVAGVKQNKIIGVIGYDPRKVESLVRGWIKGLE